MPRKKVVKATNVDGTPRKRKISGKGAKAKGANAEREIVKILTSLGLPSMRVIGSGAHAGADSDIKVGVTLTDDNEMPQADEGIAVWRAECKAWATTKDYRPNLKDDPAIVFTEPINGVEVNWQHLNQDQCSKVVLLRRAKVPQGAIAKKDWDEVWGCFVGIETLAALLRRAYPNRVFFFNNTED